jgi:uncharacterized protein (DUF433 family)
MKLRYFARKPLALAARTRTAAEEEPRHEIDANDTWHNANSEWVELIRTANTHGLDTTTWFTQCALYAQQALQATVEVDVKRQGGIPVLRGTRFTVAQTLAELAESDGVEQVATRCTLDVETIRNLLFGLAALAERPYK